MDYNTPITEDTSSSAQDEKYRVIFDELMEKIQPDITRRIIKVKQNEIVRAGFNIPDSLSSK